MSTKRALRMSVFAVAFGTAGLLGAGVASAHVTANIYGSQPQKGGSGTVVLRVPNEEENAGTVGVEVDFKPEYAISSVRYKPVPGWTAAVTKTQLPSPVKDGKNLDVTNPVTKIVFTAQPGNGLPKGDAAFGEFEITASNLPSNVDKVELPTVQTYDNGEVVHWNQESNGGAEPEHPAPTVTLAAASTAGGDDDAMTAGSAGTGSTQASADDTARWLGGAGLVVGALGLGFGGGALLRSRRTGKTSE